MLQGLLRVEGLRTGRLYVATLRQTGNLQLGPEIAVHPIDFTALMKKAEIAISMDGKGSWRNNIVRRTALCSIQYEEVYLHANETVA